MQVISWWGVPWREGTHDTQGVNTDAVLGLVIKELERQDKLKLAFHLEPYEGETPTLRRPGVAANHQPAAAQRRCCISGTGGACFAQVPALLATDKVAMAMM